MKTAAALLALLAAPLAFAAGAPPAVAIPPCCSGNSRSTALEQDLFADPSRWTFPDAKAWKWSGEGKDRVLQLIAQSDPGTKPKYRSPFNLAWCEGKEWKDFTLTAELRLTKFDAGNNDLCIAFGRAAENRFYYAHLGEKADEPHHQIHIVDNADRKPITTFRTGGTPWKEGTWHKVKIVRNTTSGDIGVWFDDMDKPVLTAQDKTLEWGKIGLGSFDDLGEFRNVKIKGTSR
ncbi:family 16 glycoside hydrolase [Haloferula sp. BvORR071]|uniref:family 16 glycoside hydrolase n=1 Tax=Haloferula sp. BvORR071 TaxID=1396141 RepID=UPI00069781C4|nr:family 16 glycoside hydrolase [Haloferula sp. BvORR071]